MSERRRENVERSCPIGLPGVRRRRLSPEALAVTVAGRNIHEVSGCSVTDALGFFADARAATPRP